MSEGVYSNDKNSVIPTLPKLELDRLNAEKEKIEGPKR